jgi:acyl-CoA dehydrogenase
VLHAQGYYRAPVPLSETLVANYLLAAVGLPVPDGPLSLIQQSGGAVPVRNAGAGNALTLSLRGPQVVLSGTAPAVPWARHARGFVVCGQADGHEVLVLVSADAKGISIANAESVSREPHDTVTFTNCATDLAVRTNGKLPPQAVLLFGALARTIMMVGAEESVLHTTVQYANDRVQFGKPIGKFQAIQQALAIMASEVTSAQSAALAAVAPRTGSGGKLSRFDIAVAKVRAGQAAGQVAAIAHQAHGAFGFTYEHTLQYATRRLWTWRAEFGAESMWAREIGEMAIRGGGQRFWENLTAGFAGPTG